MKRLTCVMLACTGMAAGFLASAEPAAAQYGWRGYDRYDSDDRYDRHYDRRRARGYGRERDYAPQQAQPRGPVVGNPGRGGSVPGGTGYRIQQGPYGAFAVPVQPGNEGRYGNPNN
ncbi:MAG: hypothetical protein ACK4VM_14170 [Bosea sp. (in: a-proteobacteria)]